MISKTGGIHKKSPFTNKIFCGGGCHEIITRNMQGNVKWNDEVIGIGHFKFHSLADIILKYYMEVNESGGWKYHGNKFLDYVNTHNGTLCYDCINDLCNWDGAY